MAGAAAVAVETGATRSGPSGRELRARARRNLRPRVIAKVPGQRNCAADCGQALRWVRITAQIGRSHDGRSQRWYNLLARVVSTTRGTKFHMRRSRGALRPKRAKIPSGSLHNHFATHQPRPFIDTLSNQTPLFPTKHVQPGRLHGRHDSMGECIESQIDLFAGRRCSAFSAGRFIRQGRERRSIGLFDRKRIANREWRATQSGGNDRRPSFISIRIEGSRNQSQQWTHRGGHGQRSRPVCARPHHRRDAGGGASSRL
jgi:hypothetical protein